MTNGEESRDCGRTPVVRTLTGRKGVNTAAPGFRATACLTWFEEECGNVLPCRPGFLENQVLRVRGAEARKLPREVEQKPGLEVETELEVGSAGGKLEASPLAYARGGRFCPTGGLQPGPAWGCGSPGSCWDAEIALPLERSQGAWGTGWGRR